MRKNKKLLEWDDYFNYGGFPPIYSAHWIASHSVPAAIRGRGGSEGEEQ